MLPVPNENTPHRRDDGHSFGRLHPITGRELYQYAEVILRIPHTRTDYHF